VTCRYTGTGCGPPWTRRVDFRWPNRRPRCWARARRAHDLMGAASARAAAAGQTMGEALTSGKTGQALADAGISAQQVEAGLDPAGYLNSAVAFTDVALAGHRARSWTGRRARHKRTEEVPDDLFGQLSCSIGRRRAVLPKARPPTSSVRGEAGTAGKAT
jgi:hypothetical protein